MALAFTAILVAAPAAAQQGQASSSVDSQKATVDGQQSKDDPSRNSPTSLAKIREALKQPAPPPLKGLDETPTFRVEVRERQRIDELLKSIKFDGGPVVPGGLYAYEQQRQIFPSVDNPLAQPYAAFSQPELVQVALTTLLERILAGKLLHAVTAAERAAAEAEAKAEVSREIAKYCAAQPFAGAGIQICAVSAAIR